MDVGELAVQLGAIRDRLKEAGEAGLQRELAAAIGKAVEPVEQEIRDGLEPRLPNRYAGVINEDLQVTRRTFTDPDGARVSVYARTTGEPKRKLRRLNDGILWHPTYGRFPRGDHRNRWFEQNVGPGWFSDPCRNAAPRAREEIIKALDGITEKVAHG